MPLIIPITLPVLRVFSVFRVFYWLRHSATNRFRRIVNALPEMPHDFETRRRHEQNKLNARAKYDVIKSASRREWAKTGRLKDYNLI